MPSKLRERLLLSRRDLHWNQIDLMEKSGVSRGYISNIERGHTENVGIEVVFALSRALGISVAYLIGLTDDPLKDMSDDDIRPDDKLDIHVREFLAIYQQLDDDKKKILLDLARHLRSSDEAKIVGAGS